MYRIERNWPLILVGLGLAVKPFWSGNAYARGELSGGWAATASEDVDMFPGAELGNYLGVPLNERGRQYAQSWVASRYSQLEHQCRPHTIPYIYRAPIVMRIWDEIHSDNVKIDVAKQDLVSIRMQLSLEDQERTIWMDGREHPPVEAPHTWMGFSTGRWEDDMLVVTTTHIKHGYIRRNGLPQSDRATVTEYFTRSGDVLTHVAVTTDPVYLSEPYVRSTTFVRSDISQRRWGPWDRPCDRDVETLVTGAQHFLPGENPFIDEFVYGLPLDAMRGGSETLVPSFIERN